jgi:hypothetical protein
MVIERKRSHMTRNEVRNYFMERKTSEAYSVKFEAIKLKIMTVIVMVMVMMIAVKGRNIQNDEKCLKCRLYILLIIP